MISDLPRDMVEEVLSKLPITSLRGVGSTCKKMNNLSKDRSFTKKYITAAKAAAKQKQKQRKEFQVVMMLDYKVYLMSVNLLNPSIEPIGKLASGVNISIVFHCKGLLLCITKDRTSLVVCNPFNGQTRWIQPRDSYHKYDIYTLGYEKKTKYSRRSHKVLRFVVDYDRTSTLRVYEVEIYSLNSNSWKVVHINPDWDVQCFYRAFSLKGNTYCFAIEKVAPRGRVGTLFLLCFDFTTERFGPPLLLPFCGRYGDIVTLSSVREEKLAVLFQKFGASAHTLKVWISSKVDDPNAVSWNKVFLAVDMKLLTGIQFLTFAGNFLVDEKKKVVVVFDKTRDTSCPTHNIAYIIGQNGYFKTVDLRGLANDFCSKLVCSYVPSSVKINQAAPPGNLKELLP